MSSKPDDVQNDVMQLDIAGDELLADSTPYLNVLGDVIKLLEAGR